MIHPPHTRFRRGLSWPGLSALEVRLMVFIVAAIALTALLQGFLAYRNALAQADALFDYQMQQTAYALRAGLPIDARGHPQGTRPEDESNELIVQVWTNEGLRIFESALGDSLPQMAVLGFADIPARGTTYRVFSLQTRSQVIQIAQDMRVRQALARDAAWRSLLPIAMLAPLLALAVGWVIRRSLAPVQRVRAEIAQRKPQDLAPLAPSALDGLPDEIRPMAVEFNTLLQRVAQALATQQRFVADAAHELRSPLAALKLQLQLLERASDPGARELAQQKLASGIDRATRLVQQLLALARQDAQAGSGTASLPQVDLSAIAMQAIADLAPAAQARKLDLGLAEGCESRPHLILHGDALALQSLVVNLLENAIKYVPEGSRIDVSWHQNAAGHGLSVEDSGPGIPESERQLVMTRFVRGGAATGSSGTGLGLAIAQAIAQRHGGRLELGVSLGLGGLRALVAWPSGEAPQR